jgi:ribosome biogenesis GTPase
MAQEGFDDSEPVSGPHSARREHRARRVNAMRLWEKGTIDDRPVKERWSREFRNPRVKKIKDPGERFDKSKTREALVLEVHRRTCVIRFDDGSVASAVYLATVVKELGEFPVVGDRVLAGELETTDSDAAYSVVRVLPRKSELKRPGPEDSVHRELVLAANIDQVVIVAAASQPPFSYGFADRFLLAADLCGLPLVMVLNKMDLTPELPQDVRDFTTLVEEFIPVSCVTGEGLDRLANRLRGRNSIFSGMSGVGKSSLVNKLIPGADLLTGNVRDRDGKGRHTTTSSSLLDFPGGGTVIDTPGIRSLGLVDLEPHDLARIFPGFFPDGRFTCKYNDCLHLSEPGCAVRAGVSEGRISKARLDSYLRILQAAD